jgi:hypothetical protein
MIFACRDHSPVTIHQSSITISGATVSDPLNDVITEAYGMRQAEREDALRILAKKKSRATLIERVDETVGLGCLR